MKKIIGLLALIFVLSSCSLFDKEEKTTPPIIDNELKEEVENMNKTSDSEGEDSGTGENTHSSTGMIQESVDIEEENIGDDDSDKTEEEVVKEFEEELDALFDLLENEE